MQLSCAHDETPTTVPSRRSCVPLAALDAGAGVLAAVLPTSEAPASGQTEAFLLSCMDFRLLDDIQRYMSGRQLTDKYDHVILAGASLGATTDKYPAWNKTFWDHLDIAITLHNIHKVMVLDHRDCGAYKVILGEDFATDPAKETAIHTTQLKSLGEAIKKAYPTLEVELLLMALDGKVQNIA